MSGKRYHRSEGVGWTVNRRRYAETTPIAVARRRIAALLRYPFHPLLLAAYFPIWLWTSNSSLFSASDTYRSIGISIVVVSFGFLLLRLIYRDRDRAAFVLTIWVAFFYAFSYLRGSLSVPSEGLTALVIITLGCLVVGGLAFMIKNAGPTISVLFNSFIAAMLIIPVARIVTIGIEDHPRTEDVAAQSPIQGAGDSSTPTVIHIVLDGYSRNDVLRSLYGFDNSSFIGALREMGFFVADRATTPYGQTLLAMSSIFSMDYINEHVVSLVKGMNKDPARRILNKDFQRSFVFRIFKGMNYSFAVVESTYSGIKIANPDYLISNESARFHLSYYETALLKFTPIYAALQKILPLDRDSATLDFALNYRGYARLQNPTFVYNHIIAPHPPFNVSADGKWSPAFTGNADGSHWHLENPNSHEVYSNGYIEKLRFTNKAILEKLRSILSEVPDPKTIVIHSDHGGGMYLDHESGSATCLKERFGAFLAVYSSNRTLAERIPDDVNLVNLYRIILREEFGIELPLLSGRSFFAPWSQPDNFSEISREALQSFGPTCRTTPPQRSQRREKDAQ